MDHRYETGTYYTHMYAYDKAGMVKRAVIPTQFILAGKGLKRTILIK